MESYAAGETTPALLEDTIGAAFERDRRGPSATGRPWSRWPRGGAGPGPSSTATSTPSRAACSRPASRRATGSASGRPTAPSGRSRRSRRPRSARSWSTSTRRTAPTSWSTPSTRAACGCWSSASSFKTSDYRAMLEEVAPACPGLERVVYLDTDDWPALLADGGVGGRRRPSRSGRRRLANTDPINIQYTSGTTGRPKGATLSHRNILNNGFFTTELIGFTADDRLCIPVPFYHCFGMVMGNLGCITHGATMVIPAPGFDPDGHAARDRRRALHRRVRRADDVHRHAERSSASPSPTTCQLAAHRGDGRLDLPGRGDEALHRRHAHGRGVHRLRHDRDLAGLVPDPRRRRPRPAYGHHRPGAPARRDQGDRPRDRRRASSAASRASSAPAATR